MKNEHSQWKSPNVNLLLSFDECSDYALASSVMPRAFLPVMVNEANENNHIAKIINAKQGYSYTDL